MIGDFWISLPSLAQDLILALAILAPSLLLGFVICRGLALLTILRSLLVRYRWTNLAFILLVALSVGIGAGLIAQELGLRQATARVAEKFDLVVTAPGDEVSMLLSTVYLQPTAAPLLGGDDWKSLTAAVREVDGAVIAPIAYGDSWQGHGIVGTTAEFVTHLSGELAEGGMFSTHEQVVVGARVPLKIGDEISPAHGTGEAAEHDAHAGEHLTVVGRMAPTGSPWDDAIVTAIESVWLTHGLGNGHSDAEDETLGPPFDPEFFPGTPAALISTPDLAAAYGLQSAFSTDRTMAFFPGAVLARLHGLLGSIREVMSVLSIVTQVLVAAAVLTGLIILSRLFARRLALLQALGAPARMIFALLWSYAAILLGLGSLLGLAVAIIAVRAMSAVLSARSGLLIEPHLGWAELHLVAACFSLSMLVALLPAALALRRPVTQELRG
ncbi:ABC transporter permease [Paracoccus albus]|uniref:ABC transporter permease n=1 Tax=Paracoccus albus TaxID=3017784 RepID=UPI0022F0C665|nr:ABC transporter permease [Paracoccus albus]WBU59743.1 ABC transporter permease [Paracoccus albus]